MMFAETLREMNDRLREVDAILLMGMDGLPIEKVINNKSLSMDYITAEFTTILRSTMHTSNEVEAGQLEEILVLSDRMILLMKAITPEYFLMMILPPDGNLGRARFELKKAKYALEKEFV